MDSRGRGHKSVYGATIEGVSTKIMIVYNPRSDHIAFHLAQYRKTLDTGNGGSLTNRECADFLGVTVAERVLSKVFKNVTVMPHGHPGYDFRCARDYLVDVKSATMNKDKPYWGFSIRKNPIPDYFLCLAFDDRQNLNPMHIWLIPGSVINHLAGLSVSVGTLAKWQQYELTDKLNQVTACCDILRR